MLLYESPEFLAVSTAGTGTTSKALDSISRAYRNAHYVRLTIRPVAQPGDEVPGVMEAKAYAIDRFIRSLPGGLEEKIRLEGPGGKVAKPIAISLLSGISAASANTILVAFAAADVGAAIDPSDWQFIVDDFGLNIGTLRTRLAAAKGFRLKVET